jgi:hypothetical protein
MVFVWLEPPAAMSAGVCDGMEALAFGGTETARIRLEAWRRNNRLQASIAPAGRGPPVSLRQLTSKARPCNAGYVPFRSAGSCEVLNLPASTSASHSSTVGQG